MNTKVIDVVAKTECFKPGEIQGSELNKTIQPKEGNVDCFTKVFDALCEQVGCLWRSVCLSQVIKGPINHVTACTRYFT